MKKQSAAGFTLIELMIAVAIVGVLASLATPMLVKYVKKAKTTEAREMLQKIAAGARVYYLDPQTRAGDITPLPSQFPFSEAMTPAVGCCLAGGQRCAPEQTQWNTPTWIALQFSLDDPHYYQYEFTSAGTSVDSTFTAWAYGDLDCDTNLSTFNLHGQISAGSGEVQKSGTIARTDELE